MMMILMIVALTLPLDSTASMEEGPQMATLIKRTISSVDIQLCVQGSLLTTQRAAFQKVLLQYLKVSILSDTAVYLERQYTSLDGGDICFLYVYQAPTPEYSVYAVSFLTTKATNRIITVPFLIPSTGATVQIPCKVDAAQWSGDDLALLGAPFPGLWKVNDVLLWGSCLLSVLFLCMSTLCCYALCTKVSIIPTNQQDQEDSKILKMNKEILSILSGKKKGEGETIVQHKMKIHSTGHKH